MHTSKAKCYAEGGLVGQLRSTANRLVGNNPKASQQRGLDPDVIGTDQPMPAATSAPAPMAINPGYKSGVPTKDNPAGIVFAKGGKVPGPKAETKDTVPAMLVPGEYVLRKDAVNKIGVDALDALNSMGDQPKAKARKKLRHRAGRRKMQAGGLVEELPQFQRPVPGAGAMLEAQMNPTSQAMVANARTAPPMSVAPPAPMTTSPGATGFTPQPRQPYNLVTQVMDAQRPPQFTTSPGAAPPSNAVPFTTPPEPIAATTAPGATPQAPRVAPGPAVALDAGGPGQIRNPNVARGILSAEGAAATQEISQQAAAQRAATAGAQTAAPAAAPPAAAPAGPSMAQQARSALSSGAQSVRNGLSKWAGAGWQRAAAPVQLATGIVNSLDTPTDDYRTRFGIGPNEGSNPLSAAVRDVGVRSLGLASDIGNAVAFGIPGLFYRDKQSPSGEPSPIDRLATPDAAVAQTSPAAPPAAPAAPKPGASTDGVPTQPTNVTRVGNSYSGPANIAGDITVNGAAPRGGVSVMPGAPGGGLALSGSDQALQAARMAAIQRGDVESVKASFGGDFGPKVDPVQALMNNGRPMTTKKAAAIAALQRSAAEGAGAQADLEGKSLANRAARELLKAQLAVTNAKDAASEVKAIDKLRALQGKYEKELPNRFTVVPGGQEVGPDGITLIKRPDRVLNNQTGQWLDQPQAKAGPTPRAQYDQMKKGDRYIGTDGKEYIKG